jgi:surface polysaccharide O-acyltransferase-like enzyme
VTADAALAFSSYLRIAAIGAVVLIHSSSGLVLNNAIRGSATWWVGVVLNRGAGWAVPVFIMVSGALLLAPRPNEGAAAFYRRRLDRIAIPLVVAHVGYFLVRWRLDHESLTASRIVADLLHAKVYTQLYFFWIILGLYVVTPLLRRALAGLTHREIALVGAGGIGFMWAAYAATAILAAVGATTTLWQPAALVLWIPYLGYFVMGYALRDLGLRGRWLALTIGLLLVATAASIWQFVDGGGLLRSLVIGGGYQGLPVATSALAVFVIARSLVPATSRFAVGTASHRLRGLAALTLGVFVVHLVVLRYVWRLPGLSFANAEASVPVTLEAWLITLIASFALCLVLARIPVLRRTIGM